MVKGMGASGGKVLHLRRCHKCEWEKKNCSATGMSVEGIEVRTIWMVQVKGDVFLTRSASRQKMFGCAHDQYEKRYEEKRFFLTTTLTQDKLRNNLPRIPSHGALQNII